MKTSDVVIRRVILSDFQENSYCVSLRNRLDCVIIDPGMDPAPLVDHLREKQVTPVAILITHGHWDHVGGIDEIRKLWPSVKVYIGEQENHKLQDPFGNLSKMFGYPLSTSRAADVLLKDGDFVAEGGVTFKAFLTPGHSNGHYVYALDLEDREFVFCGDVIFRSGIGRSDFPDGDHETLLKSIRNVIFAFPPETVLCPGHGLTTTVAYEKVHNPFV